MTCKPVGFTDPDVKVMGKLNVLTEVTGMDLMGAKLKAPNTM